jgi:hypothetical protein
VPRINGAHRPRYKALEVKIFFNSHLTKWCVIRPMPGRSMAVADEIIFKLLQGDVVC